MQQPQQQNNGSLAQGRIVWTNGNLFTGKPMTDDNGKPVLDENGQQCVSFGFGLAVPKTLGNGAPNPQVNEIWAIMQREALTIFPNGNFPNDFAWKYKDGDGNDHNGKAFADRDGYKNCFVFACTTQIPIKYFKYMGGNNVLVNDGFKCGDYVNVQLNIKAHPAKGRGKAGLYMNPTACQLIAEGKEIINAPSGDQVFGMTAPVYTVGNIEAPTAAPMPSMGGMPAPGGMPQQQQYAPQQQQQYAPQGMPAAQPVQAPEHYGVLPGQFQQAPAPQHQQQYAPQQGQMPGQGMPQPQQQQYAPQGMPAAQPQQQQYAPQQGGMPGMPGMPR